MNSADADSSRSRSHCHRTAHCQTCSTGTRQLESSRCHCCDLWLMRAQPERRPPDPCHLRQRHRLRQMMHETTTGRPSRPNARLR